MSAVMQPACDWLSGVHRYPVNYEVKPRNGGLVMKISPEGEIEWETASWETVRCPSSDTSLRVKCDGQKLYFSGNIGRFQQQDNRTGLTVLQCIDRWCEVLAVLGFDLHGFGTLWGEDTVGEWGTNIRRIDLCANYGTSNYAALTQACMVRRLGQKLPVLGKYGPMWGYDARRSNWWKAKLYDKDAELARKRRSDGGATTARFEVQLGSEYLKREGLHKVKAWAGEGNDMGQVVFGHFADQLFREQIEVQRWGELPPRLQHWATCWREGRDIRAELSTSGYYKVRKQLLEYGLDIGAPCNVLALTRNVQVIEVQALENLRAA